MQMMRRGAFLSACTPFDADMLETLPQGKSLVVRVSQRRSVASLRLYWAMLKLVCDNLDQPLRPDTLHAWIKLKLGYVEQIKLRTGEIIEVPGSVAFDKMDAATFRGFFDAAKALITDQIIPQLDSAKLEKEAHAMLGMG